MIIKKLARQTEFYVALIIVVLALFIEYRSGLFFTANNFLDLLRAMIIPGMFGLLEFKSFFPDSGAIMAILCGSEILY